MPDRSIHLSVVVPVRNGADRLPVHLEALRQFLCAQARPAELVLVDDHSEPGAARLLADFAGVAAGVTLLRNDANRGKGFSVARGMRAARGAYRVFTDADLAYPVDEIGKIARELDRGCDVAIACRVLPESRYLMSPSFFHYLYTRHVMSRLFNGVVRLTLLPGILDTQAGLKGFTARAAEVIFPRLTIPGFGFDVEALYIARKHGLAITQAAVRYRYDEEPSTVRFTADAAGMLRDLVKIRWNDWRGRYG
ncbi:MAG TPA: glycosyltransferase [Gemmatimonadales bacterium]|nr:glycosyltransferase [Gemmatimonadales bacterium]